MGWLLSPFLRCMSDRHHPRGRIYAYWCPACDHAHAVPLDQKNEIGAGPWSFNGDFENPTFSPSLDIHRSNTEIRCHSIVSNGLITFCSDCGTKHPLAGRTVKMIPWPSVLD